MILLLEQSSFIIQFEPSRLLKSETRHERNWCETWDLQPTTFRPNRISSLYKQGKFSTDTCFLPCLVGEFCDSCSCKVECRTIISCWSWPGSVFENRDSRQAKSQAHWETVCGWRLGMTSELICHTFWRVHNALFRLPCTKPPQWTPRRAYIGTLSKPPLNVSRLQWTTRKKNTQQVIIEPLDCGINISAKCILTCRDINKTYL